MSVDERMNEFVKDGAGEHEDDAGVSRIDIDVFAFMRGNASHTLDFAKPIVGVLCSCNFDGDDLADEVEVALVDFDVGLSCVSVGLLVF